MGIPPGRKSVESKSKNTQNDAKKKKKASPSYLKKKSKVSKSTSTNRDTLMSVEEVTSGAPPPASDVKKESKDSKEKGTLGARINKLLNKYSEPGAWQDIGKQTEKKPEVKKQPVVDLETRTCAADEDTHTQKTQPLIIEKIPEKVPVTPPPAPSRELIPSAKKPLEPVKSMVNTTSTTSTADKWAGEMTAKIWMDKCGFPIAKAEFEKLQKMLINVDKDCKKWQAHMKLNQSEDHPALDTNLFKCSDEKDYVNASLVDASLPRNVYISQMPVKGSEEAFWKAFFDMRITYMTILSEDLVDFFPKRNTEFVHYGSMFVNNRRVDIVSDDVVRFAIEVLPAGYSNSIISTITVIKNWQVDSVHAKHAVVMKEILELSNFFTTSPSDENAMIMSKYGVGRSGYFVALAAAVQKLEKKQEPDIYEIVRSIRAQRPRSVDYINQYASLYLAMFYYIKKKTTKPAEISADKKPSTSPDPSEALGKKAAQLSQLFTTALTAELEAAAGRSIMVTLR